MQKEKYQYQGVEGEISKAKNLMLDQIVLSTLVFGILLTVAGFFYSKTFTANTTTTTNLIMNLMSFGILTFLYLRKKEVEFKYKSAILLVIFLIIGIRALYNYGIISQIIVFFIVCSVILSITFDKRNSYFFISLIALPIIITGYLFSIGYITINFDANNLLTSPIYWTLEILIFLYISHIIYLTILLWKKTLTKNVKAISIKNERLLNNIKKLNTVIQDKELYQAKLESEEKKFRGLFQSSRDGIILLDQKAKILDLNPASKEITGYTSEDVRDIKDVFELVVPESRKIIKDRFNEVSKGDLQGLAQMEIFTKNGQRIPIEFSSNMIIMEDSVVIVTTIRDISIRKKLEFEKYNLAIQAEERERERFSKDLHDDLGPTFSTIKLYLETLYKKEADEKTKDVLSEMTKIVDISVKRIREISHNLSPYLLKEEGLLIAIEQQIIKINQLHDLKISFESNIEHSNRLPEEIEVLLYRIFQELLANTIKHAEATEIATIIKKDLNEFTFSYIDNGKGYDFKSSQHTGAGIGLKNILNRVKAMKGSMLLDYINGKMHTTITIPVYDKDFFS